MIAFLPHYLSILSLYPWCTSVGYHSSAHTLVGLRGEQGQRTNYKHYNSHSDNDTQRANNNWLRFIVVTFTDSAAQVSLFAIHKDITITMIMVIKMESGDFQVECTEKAQACNVQAHWRVSA